MTDIFDPAKRSDIMSKIRGKNSKVELIVFAYLRKRKIYFQKHYARAPGSPDVALPRKKRAVFIDGDFWHGRTVDRLIDRRGGDPEDYWIRKISRNVERDSEQVKALTLAGWTVLRVWESDIKRKSTSQSSLKNIEQFLLGDTRTGRER